MTATIFEQWTKMSKLTTEPAMEYFSLYAKSCADLVKQNLQASSDFVQTQSEQLGLLSQAKSPEEFFNQQSKWFAKQAPKGFDYCADTMSTLQECVKETGKIFQKHTNQFTKTDQKATQK